MKLLLSTICIALLALFAYQVMSYPLQDGKTHNEQQVVQMCKLLLLRTPKPNKWKGLKQVNPIMNGIYLKFLQTT